MFRRSFSAALLIITAVLSSVAQVTGDKILMTVAGAPVTAGEFTRMYRKSYDPSNIQDIDNYLQQFIVFKLKVADAVKEGYDTTRAFRTELKGYRDQLAQSYLTDPETKERVLKQAYQRSLTEINAWHILIALSPDATPEDTLKAWKKARDVRERIVQGESFESVARSSSDDPSVRNNGGNLGYFTIFQMITPFEDAAYSLKKGEISSPVRTPFGYHIIKVTDRRASNGKIKVAHIMRSVPPGTSEKDASAAEDTIRMIYQKLSAGASFSELAEKYSDHKETSSKGGELNWFGTGEVISDFSEAAFALRNNGDFSKPVKTVYGWHIIMRLDKKPHGTYEETKSYLESRLSESYLSSASRKSFVEKLKKEYKFRINPAAFEWFVKNTDTLIIQGKARYKRAGMPAGAIYTFAGQQLTTREFANHIEKRGSMIDTKDSSLFIRHTLDTYLSDHIINYENSILEKKYPEFRYLMNEFHDGILLFEISGNKVWNKAQTDSSGLKRFYEAHKNNYLTKEAFEGKCYLLRKKDGGKELSSAWKRYGNRKDVDSRLIRKFITRGDTLLSITPGTWTRGQSEWMDQFEWKTGAHETKADGFPAIVVVNRVIPPVPRPFNEIQGEIIQEWQEELEREWIGQLKTRYDVKIDDTVLNEIKKNLSNGK